MKNESNLAEVKQDFFQILEKAPWEAYAVRLAVIKGQIHGKQYFGECCCIKGIIAADLGLPLIPGSGQSFTQAYDIGLGVSSSPLELFILGIRPGNNPENDERCRQLLTWLDEFIAGEEAKKATKLEASVQAGLEEALAAALPVAQKAVPELVQV